VVAGIDGGMAVFMCWGRRWRCSEVEDLGRCATGWWGCTSKGARGCALDIRDACGLRSYQNVYFV